MPELNGWPKSDANIILSIEIVLMTLFLTMNTVDLVLQSRGVEHYTQTASFWITGNFTWLYNGLSTGALMGIERTCWWLHILGIFVFLNYLPFSKHLHILLAFPNAYYGKLVPQGEVKNMPDIQNEVLYMMEPEKAPSGYRYPGRTPPFWGKRRYRPQLENLLDAYSCTECGRCTAVCPANLTGKKLSPRKIMMDTRDRMEEMGKNIAQIKPSRMMASRYSTIISLLKNCAPVPLVRLV